VTKAAETNGNGVVGALRSWSVLLTMLGVAGGLFAFLWQRIETVNQGADQRLTSNTAMRAEQIDGVETSDRSQDAKISSLDTAVASILEKLVEVETQFDREEKIRALEDLHARERSQWNRERSDMAHVHLREVMDLKDALSKGAIR
jgi:uncharacterized protein HemX